MDEQRSLLRFGDEASQDGKVIDIIEVLKKSMAAKR